MLFLLFLYYLGANASPSLLPTAPRSPTATLPNNALSNFVICECSYERSIWKIVSGCLLTIFACTWISVHPNLPDPSDTRWKVLLRRSGYMFWTLVTPELVVYWAMRQWVGAKAIETHYQADKWTRTHGYFLLMGGFMLYDCEGNALGVLSPERLQGLSDQGNIDVPRVTEKEINDRSKGDALAKGIVILQSSWFVMQCFARFARHLDITELEVVTLAYAILNGVMYFFWWSKPLDVHCHIPVYMKLASNASNVVVQDPQSRSQRPGDTTISDVPEHLHSHHRWQAPAIYLLLKLQHLIVTFFLRLGEMTGSPRSNTIQDGAMRVPTFYAPTIQDFSRADYTLACSSTVLGLIFGGVHCIPWLSQFPTYSEAIIWRASAVIITGVPVVTTLAMALTLFKPRGPGAFYIIQVIATHVVRVLVLAGLVLYLPARAALLIQACITLRALPPGASSIIEWTTFLPHL